MKSNPVEKFQHDSSLADMDLQQKKKSRFSWIGGLAEFQGEYASVELQERASEWRVESVLRKLPKNRKKGQEELE